jgi:hypothetical protein
MPAAPDGAVEPDELDDDPEPALEAEPLVAAVAMPAAPAMAPTTRAPVTKAFRMTDELRGMVFGFLSVWPGVLPGHGNPRFQPTFRTH